MYTVKKAERDAGPKHEGDGQFHHPRRTIGKIRQHQRLGLSIYMGDWIFRHASVRKFVQNIYVLGSGSGSRSVSTQFEQHFSLNHTIKVSLLRLHCHTGSYSVFSKDKNWYSVRSTTLPNLEQFLEIQTVQFTTLVFWIRANAKMLYGLIAQLFNVTVPLMCVKFLSFLCVILLFAAFSATIIYY
jgi:hypothetical protein